MCLWKVLALSAPVFQHTVKAPALFAGIGVHTGAYTRVAVRPAAADTGVVFVRTDITDCDNRVPVSPEAVCKTQLGTVITNAAGVTVSTIEHLMAALVMSGIDNAVVELDGPEMPIMDGSSLPFLRVLDRAGRRQQGAEPGGGGNAAASSRRRAATSRSSRLWKWSTGTSAPH